MLHSSNQAARQPRGNGLDRLAARARPILACYFPLGDPVFDGGIDAIYRSAGVDIFELGLPSADPYMDGADVAGAMRRALASGADPYARLADMVAWLAAERDGLVIGDRFVWVGRFVCVGRWSRGRAGGRGGGIGRRGFGGGNGCA